MTKPPVVLAVALAALIPLFLGCGLAVAGDETLPPGVVAQVAGRDLTFDGFCLAAAQQKLPLLKRGTSEIATIFKQLLEERIVSLEAQRLGVSVTEAEIDQAFEQNDKDVRRESRGQKTLRDLMRERGLSEAEFRDAIRYQLEKDKIASHPTHLGDTLPKKAANPAARLAQIAIVIGKLLTNAQKIAYVPVEERLLEHLTVEVGKAPTPDCIARVELGSASLPLTLMEFGQALVLRLSTSEVHEILDREIKTALLTMEGYQLSDAELDDEIETQRKHWLVQRMLTSQEALSEITYDAWIDAKYQMTVDEMKRKRFWRGYLALVRRMRQSTTPAEVQAEYEKYKISRWGEYILVTEIQIEFRPENSRFVRRDLRTQREALQLAREIPRRLAAGEPFENIVKSINAQQDRTFRAQRRRLRPNTDDAMLWQRAEVMKDNDLSSPFETLSQVHLLRREERVPAPRYATVEPVVRESIARRKAREWLDEKVTGPVDAEGRPTGEQGLVKMRWPLPQRGK